MNGYMNSLVDTTVQCWGCDIFDRLFQVVSSAAAVVYEQFAAVCMILFCVMFGAFMIYIFWQQARGKNDGAGLYKDTLQPAFINGLVALTLLGMGVVLPRFVTTVTFEPVAEMSLIYTQSMLKTDTETVNERVTYQPKQMAVDGFFRPQLRDTIINLMKTTITQFQSYMKLGIAVMDKAFSWSALLGVGALIKHIVLFMVGLYLFYGFFKLFVRFCFCFVDVIVAMAFFAFFFPFTLMMVPFNASKDVPSWISNMGKKFGNDQFKKLINAIITLTASVLTYTVIMVIIATYFTEPSQNTSDVMNLILSGEVFAADLSDNNLAQMTLMSAAILIYVVNFIYGRIPEVTKMVLGAFNVGTENKLSEKMADDVIGLTTNAVKMVASGVKTIVAGEDKAPAPSAKNDKPKDDKAKK